MKKAYTLCTILILIMNASNSFAKENQARFFAINYNQRLHFVKFQQLTSLQNHDLPQLTKNARFHGMKLEGAIKDNVIIGLYANGSLKDSKNNFGYTSWGGGLGVVTISYRYNLPGSLFTSVGSGLGCGRFTYSTALWNGTESITSDNDAIFLEPNINMGYIFKEKLILTIEASYLFSIVGNEYNVGAKNIPDVFPNGWVIGASIGYQFPFIN